MSMIVANTVFICLILVAIVGMIAILTERMESLGDKVWAFIIVWLTYSFGMITIKCCLNIIDAGAN